MDTLGCRPAFVAVCVLAALAAGTPAAAVEYRMKVANIFDEAMMSFLGQGELADGATGPGLQRLGATLDQGSGERGMIVTHRPLSAVPDRIARAWGGVAVQAPIARGGVVSYWDEVRWDGRPGERSIWIVRPSGRENPQAVSHVVLKGTTPLTLYRPYTAACGTCRLPVMELGIPLIAFQESRGDVWDAYAANSLDLRHGIGVVVGVNSNAVFANLAYIIVEQGPTPTTFEVVITWSNSNAQAPGGGGRGFGTF
jgi:hypothetical protein